MSGHPGHPPGSATGFALHLVRACDATDEVMLPVAERRRPGQPARGPLLPGQRFCLQVLSVLQPAALPAARRVCRVRHAQGGHTDTGSVLTCLSNFAFAHLFVSTLATWYTR